MNAYKRGKMLNLSEDAALRRWAPETTLRFIEEYAKYPSLWDPNCKDYKKKLARNVALHRIMAAMATRGVKLDLNGTKLKIRILRNTYINELRKISQSRISGCERPYKSQLPWFKAADSFLRNVVKLPEIVTRNCDDDSDREEEASPTQRDVIIEFLHAADSQASCNDTYGDGHQQQQVQIHRFSNRPRPSSSRDFADSSSFQAAESTSRSIAMPCPSSQDEFDVFGHSIALQMKQLPLELALELQEEIQRLVVRKRLEYIRPRNPSFPEESPTNSVEMMPEISHIKIDLEQEDE